MEVNFGIEYLCKFAVISTLGGSASGGKSPVGLHNKASFVKFGSSETLFSNLTKSPLFYLSSVPALRSALAKHGSPWW